VCVCVCAHGTKQIARKGQRACAKAQVRGQACIWGGWRERVREGATSTRVHADVRIGCLLDDVMADQVFDG